MMSSSRLWILCGAIALAIACMGTAMAQTQNQGSGETRESAQGGGSQAAGQASSAGSGAPTRGSSGGAAIRVVPFLNFSERYDSNVFFAPRKVSDFVTNISPNARIEYVDDLVTGSLTGGATAEAYVRNPELNYVGGNGVLSGTLDNLVGKMIRGLGLTIDDSVMYTPQPMPFVTPQAPETSFLRGIQAIRNNYLTNSGNVLTSYAMTPLSVLNASYSNQIMRFFNQSSPGATSSLLFNTTTQTFSGGPEYHISSAQSIGASYVYQHMFFEPNTGEGGSNTVVTHGALATWKSSLTREWAAEVSPGITVLSGLSDPVWTMRASLRWSDQRTTAGLLYSRGVFPSYFIGGGALISDVVNASLTYTINNQLSLAAAANYGLNVSISGQQNLGQQNLRFESYDYSATVSYTFYRGMTASLIATQGNFSYVQQGSNIQFDRHTIMLSLTAEWN